VTPQTHRLGALKCDAFIDLDWSSDAANKPFKTSFSVHKS